MSAVMGAVKNVGFSSELEKDEVLEGNGGSAGPSGDGPGSSDDVPKLTRKLSHASMYSTEDGEDAEDGDDDDDDEEDSESVKSKNAKKIDLGPLCSLKEQIEKDKDDDSLMRWKEQLLGSVDLAAVGENLEPEVKVLSLTILSPDRPDLELPIPFMPNSKGYAFALKDGSRYRLKFTFLVSNNIVSGLKYTNTVWKTGMRVDNTRVMLGTFSPQQEPYTYELEEETTPSGIFARGSYSARTKFVDDDGKVYLDISYTFEIRKEWPSPS
ncbi:rho GDP-dissociation inhibitor 1-like [Nymphaea colorata]|nr:rho GDP-dissociation inhibitor 1-like [Nymphaea colorata]XP_031478801.1 rho GDP-dissociation inhibitor 1-like [Nymphaea colorata]XP_031478802.1 rho GDP-dissociation inhibitor 1-like [Nymphaea colorata]